MRAEEIEAKIEQHYRTIPLKAATRDRVVSLVEQRLAALAATSKREIARCQGVLTGLMEEERKLLQKHYADDVSDELYAEEAVRIKRERTGAQTIVDRLNVSYDELSTFMTLVLRLANSSLHDLYLRAKPYVRRIMNHAIFEAIWLEPDENGEIIIRSKKASPFAELLAAQTVAEKIEAHGTTLAARSAARAA